jgi:L-ascorbate metabolism protein UlaG (beta-lactamase superfamily)
MKIQFLAHSMFLITTNAGTRIVTDPFDPISYGEKLAYRPFRGPADIVTVSHDHKDHGRPEVVGGSPVVIKGNGKFVASEVEFLGVATFHDKSQGAERGRNTVFVISADGLRIAHFGDLGHVLTADQAAEIGVVDVALIPVGGYYTIDAAEADRVVSQVEARTVIPMHYRTEKCDFPIAGVEDFLAGKTNVVRAMSSEIEISKDAMPGEQRIIVLDHEL